MDRRRSILSGLFFRRLYSDKEPVPFVMFSRGGGTAALKGSIQQTEAGNSFNVHPSPVRKLSTTGPANLIRKEPQAAFLDSVIVGFDDSLPVTIAKPNQAPLLNGRAEQLVQL